MKAQVAAKLTALIQSEATKQLAENYHELLPTLIKTDVDQIEDDLDFAVGASYFQIEGRRLFIPLLYMNGQVDSMSYIGDVETNRMYGLTKKMYKRLISANKLQLGAALGKREEERLKIDKGIIGRLFATPQTMSTKVASAQSDEPIISLLDNHLFRTQFTKMASQPEFLVRLKRIYSPQLFNKLAAKNESAKISRVTQVEGQRKFTSLDQIRTLPTYLRKTAAIEIATNGYYKIAGAGGDGMKAAVLSVPKFGEQLFQTDSELEVLTTPGIYNAVTKSLDLVPVIVTASGLERKIYYKDDSGVVAKDYPGFVGKGYVGLPAGMIGGDPRQHIISVLGKPVKPNEARNITLCLTKDDLSTYQINTVTAVGDTAVVTTYGGYYGEEPGAEEITIEISERYNYSKRGSTIFVNPKHVVFTDKISSGRLGHLQRNREKGLDQLLTSDDMEQTMIKTAKINVRYSAGMYDYDHERFTASGVHERLDSEGYDPQSVRLIMKTAVEAGGMDASLEGVPQTLKAILAEMAENKQSLRELQAALQQMQGGAGQEGGGGDEEQMKQQIVELAGSVGADGEQIIQKATEQGIPIPEVLSRLEEEVAQVQQQGQQPQEGTGQAPIDQDQAAMAEQQAMQDPAMMGQQQAMQDPAMMQQDPTQQGQPMPQQGQQPGQPMPGQGQGEKSPQALQQEGFNTQMTPQMLDQLQEVADKDILNASIIQYLIDTPDAKGVVGQYLDDVEKGVNGLAKTLLTVEIQRKNFAKSISEGKLESFINGGKTILNRLTDFTIDAAQIN